MQIMQTVCGHRNFRPPKNFDLPLHSTNTVTGGAKTMFTIISVKEEYVCDRRFGHPRHLKTNLADPTFTDTFTMIVWQRNWPDLRSGHCDWLPACLAGWLAGWLFCPPSHGYMAVTSKL